MTTINQMEIQSIVPLQKNKVSQAILRDLKAKPHSLHEACKTHRVLKNQIDCYTWFKLNKSSINSIMLYICTK